jgi:hypothetical protein
VVVGDVDLAGGLRVVARIRGVVHGDAVQRLGAVGVQAGARAATMPWRRWARIPAP